MEFHEIAYNFLKSAKVSISKDYLRERLESHPDYPSMWALTDILDELGILNSALRIDQKENYRELNFPFLAHVVSKTGRLDFLIVRSQNQIDSDKDFLNKWTGITLALGTKKTITHEEHHTQHRQEKFERTIIWLLGSLLVLSFFLPHLMSFNLVFFLHSFLSLIGVFISSVIIGYSLGIKTGVSDLFCKIEASGCNSVLKSKLGRLWGDITLGDVAVMFFAGQCIYTFFSQGFERNENIVFLTFVQIFPFLFTFISLIYQWFIKSWCKLCLFLITVIWLQTANLVFYFIQIQNEISSVLPLSSKYYSFLVVSMLLAASWFVVKPFFLAKKNSLFQKITIRKWRQDPNWFNALLPLHKSIDNSVWDKEIQYGNPTGVLQILIISSPFCQFCAKAHHELEQILEKHPDDIGVRVRFTVATLNSEAEDYKAVFHILNAYDELVWKKKITHSISQMQTIVGDWFKLMDSGEWFQQYPFQSENKDEIKSLLERSFNWANNMKIHQTPAFFINGFEMPNPHTFKDLFLFVSDYIEILKSNPPRIAEELSLN